MLDRKILFLPGLLCTGEIFSGQTEGLPQGFTPLISALPSCDNMKEIAESIWQDIEGEAIICGLSMGGIIAMEMIKQQAWRVSGLILLDTNAYSEPEEVSNKRNELIKLSEKIGPGNMTLEKLADSMLFPGNRENNYLKQILYSMAEEIGQKTLECHGKALQYRPDYTKVLRHFRKPSLIINGDSDLLCPADRHEHLSNILINSEWKTVTDCGHISSLEKPEHTSSLINSWLIKNFTL